MLTSAVRWRLSAIGLVLVESVVQAVVLVLQVEHHRDAGQVQPGLEQGVNALQPVQVVLAVATGATGGALGSFLGQLLHVTGDERKLFAKLRGMAAERGIEVRIAYDGMKVEL